MKLFPLRKPLYTTWLKAEGSDIEKITVNSIENAYAFKLRMGFAYDNTDKQPIDTEANDETEYDYSISVYMSVDEKEFKTGDDLPLEIYPNANQSDINDPQMLCISTNEDVGSKVEIEVTFTDGTTESYIINLHPVEIPETGEAIFKMSII